MKSLLDPQSLFKTAESLKAPHRAQPFNADFMTREFLVGIQ